MRWFSRWYGAGPLHLLALLGCFALAGYAAAELLPNNAVGIPVWLAGAVIGHDLLLMPLYTIADRSAMAVFRHRRTRLSAVPGINYLRVPVVLSGLLLLIWFPLIFRLPSRFPATTTLSLDPYLWHWLAVTGALFLLSATALALRLGAVRRGTRKGRTSGGGVAAPASDVNKRGYDVRIIALDPLPRGMPSFEDEIAKLGIKPEFRSDFIIPCEAGFRSPRDAAADANLFHPVSRTGSPSDLCRSARRSYAIVPPSCMAGSICRASPVHWRRVRSERRAWSSVSEAWASRIMASKFPSAAGRLSGRCRQP